MGFNPGFGASLIQLVWQNISVANISLVQAGGAHQEIPRSCDRNRREADSHEPDENQERRVLVRDRGRLPRPPLRRLQRVPKAHHEPALQETLVEGHSDAILISIAKEI